MIYTKKKRHGLCPLGAYSLLKLTNNHKYNGKAPRRHCEEGTGSAWRTQGRLHRDGDNGAGPWMRRSSPDGGEGGKRIPSRGNST